MAKVIRYMPEIEGDEQLVVAQLLTDLSEEQAEQFAHIYRERRKDPTITLVTGLLVFLGLGGVQRFYLDQIGLGILFLLTGGLCLVGNIIDLVNYKNLTFKYNRKQAGEVAALVEATFD